MPYDGYDPMNHNEDNNGMTASFIFQINQSDEKLGYPLYNDESSCCDKSYPIEEDDENDTIKSMTRRMCNSCLLSYTRTRLRFKQHGRNKWISLAIAMLVIMSIRHIADLRHSLYFATLLIAQWIATVTATISKRKIDAPQQSQQRGSCCSFPHNTSDSMLIVSSKSISGYGSSCSMKLLMQESLEASSLSLEKIRDETVGAAIEPSATVAASNGNESFFVHRSRVDTNVADDWGQFTHFDGFEEEEDDDYSPMTMLNGNGDAITAIVPPTTASGSQMNDDPYFSITKMIRKRRGDKLSVCKLGILREIDEEVEDDEKD